MRRHAVSLIAGTLFSCAYLPRAFATVDNYMFSAATCRPQPYSNSYQLLYSWSPEGNFGLMNNTPAAHNEIVCPFRIKPLTGTYGISYVNAYVRHNSRAEDLICILRIYDGTGTRTIYTDSRETSAA